MPALAYKDTDQPFPCQDNPCGCQNAEQCWTSCCCYTVEEHWAWARAHNVEPPSYAKRPAEGEWSVTPQREQELGQSTCPHCKKQPEPKPASSKTTRWVSGASALRCQGANLLWVAGAAVPPLLPVTWSPHLALAGRFSHLDEIALSRPSDPLEPPPREHSI
jgi:hypothetical protein